MAIAFNLDESALAGCRILIDREALPVPGDCEAGFVERAVAIRRHDAPFGRAAIEAASFSGIRWLIAIRNPRLVLDNGLSRRLGKARARLELIGERAAIGAAGGMSLADGPVSRLYASSSPTLPVETRCLPLLDPLPDMWIADAAFILQTAEEGTLPDIGFETALSAVGWERERLSLYLPELSAGIDGAILPRASRPLRVGRKDSGGQADGVRAELERTVAKTIAAECPALSLSLVVRTRFDRAHLLDRLLTTVSRARLDDMDLEVVVSTDIEDPLDRFSALEDRHPYLVLRLQQNPPSRHSRVGNMLGGLSGATKRHVALVDDDDYVDLFAFEHMARAGFLGAQPLMFAPSPVHEEVWESTPSGRHVLARSTFRSEYPADGWRRIWQGSNALPVSAFVAPRSWLIDRLKAFSFDHDLSEDYALLLLMLTAPDLPPIHELAHPFVHISLRGQTENATMMTDRRPWSGDISRYLTDLTDTGVCGPGFWRLVTGLSSGERTSVDPAETAQAAEVARLRREVALLRADRDRLRRIASAAVAPGPARHEPIQVLKSEPEPV